MRGYIARVASLAMFAMAATQTHALELKDATIGLWKEDNRVLVLDGALGPNTEYNFKFNLNANPQVKTILLNSGGGLVSAGLDIAQIIANRQLDTWIPETALCASACSVIYFSGTNRYAQGYLGVHQIAMSRDNNAEVQTAASDMIEAFNRYGTHPDVFAIMLRTPPDKMYYFTEIEKLNYQITRGTLSVPVFNTPVDLPPLVPPEELFGGDLAPLVPPQELFGDKTPVLKGLNLPN